MPMSMEFGAPWAAYFLGFVQSSYQSEPKSVSTRWGTFSWGKPHTFNNYTTVEGKTMWQSNVGYASIYDSVFSLGGPIKRIRYDFQKTDANGITTYYCIWLWKGDYWNLGAGAEIGIYSTQSEYNFNQNFYNVDISLVLHVRMQIKYREFGLVSQTLNDFHQTNWWVCSFTPEVELPNANWIDVEFDVRFDGINYFELMKPFYEKYCLLNGNPDEWTNVSVDDLVARENKVNIPGNPDGTDHSAHFCGCTHPTQCTCSYTWCAVPCMYYTNACPSTCTHYGESYSDSKYHMFHPYGFQFKINY